jgi:hypothetical protein
VVTDSAFPILGEASFDGPVVIAWDEAAANARHPERGHNVVYHEFAHKLDMDDGVVDGTPRLPDSATRARWIEVCTAEFEALRAGTSRAAAERLRRGQPGRVLRRRHRGLRPLVRSSRTSPTSTSAQGFYRRTRRRAPPPTPRPPPPRGDGPGARDRAAPTGPPASGGEGPAPPAPLRATRRPDSARSARRAASARRQAQRPRRRPAAPADRPGPTGSAGCRAQAGPGAHPISRRRIGEILRSRVRRFGRRARHVP